MIFSWQLKIEFELKGKTHKCVVDKLRIPGHRPEYFFRVGARSGNRNIICHNGQWMEIGGNGLPDEVLDALGAAIEKAMIDQL